MNEADFFAKGEAYREAFRLLVQGCDIPPSYEVFAYQLKLERNRNGNLAPEGMARRLAESYHRVTGFFRDTP